MIRFSKDGAEMSSDALLKLEARRARQMMAVLVRKLGAQEISKLFAEEIAAHSADEKEWLSRSNGELRASVATARVEEGNAKEFIDWFVAGYNGQDAAAMQRAHPEHLGAMPLPDGRILIVEVPGHTGRPANLHLRILQDWSGVPVALDPDMPHRMMGQAETADGEKHGYLLHQFCDTHPGFKAKLAIYWPAATPDAFVEGHAEHLMVEFNNWFRMYLQSRSHAGDLMSIVLTCGL